MCSGVDLYGGFAGTEAQRDQRDWVNNVTTIDGQNSVLHVVTGAGNATIDGFTITRGNANGASAPDNQGGGMLNYAVSPTVANCILTENSSDCCGAGMSNYGYGGSASPTVTNCIFENNSAGGSGGGMCNYYVDSSCLPTVTNCTFTGNSANSSNGYGGGMYSYNSSPTVTNSIFWEDSASDHPEIYTASTATLSYNDIEGCGGSGAGWDTAMGSDGGGNIDAEPKFVGGGDYHLQAGSPCIDAGTSSGAPDEDLEGNSRPKGAGYDMGAYEFLSDISHDYSLPGGSGNVTDYRIFTVPVELETGSALKAQMEEALGTYNKYQWRVFAYGSDYIEMDSLDFSSLPAKPGNAFWIISTGTDTISFSGQPARVGTYYTISLSPGWNMFGLPWPTTFDDIELGKIAVSDGVNNYWITSGSNSLTQKSVWDYTGTGPDSGYEQLASGSTLKPGKGYWIKVESGSAVNLLVPKDNAGGYFEASSRGVSGSSTGTDSDKEPPPPPGGGISSTSDSSGGAVPSGGGCFIATAAYGSRLHPYVKTLRGFRDSYLLSNAPGRKLVAFYYKYSPPVAEVIAHNAPLKYLTRLLLLPLIGLSAFMLYASPVVKCAFLVILSLVLVRIVMIYGRNKRRCL